MTTNRRVAGTLLGAVLGCITTGVLTLCLWHNPQFHVLGCLVGAVTGGSMLGYVCSDSDTKRRSESYVWPAAKGMMTGSGIGLFLTGPY
jgi:uncharacterized transporter YbjL